MENKPTRDEIAADMLRMDDDPLFCEKYREIWEDAYDISPHSRYARALSNAVKLGITHKDKQIEGLTEALKNACACSTRHAGWCPQCKYLAQMKEEHGE